MGLDGMAEGLPSILPSLTWGMPGFEERLQRNACGSRRELQAQPAAQATAPAARLRLSACLEDIDYAPRGLDRSLLRHLSTGDWLARGQNVVITGPTGAGKTFIACALGNAACRQTVPHNPGCHRSSRMLR